MVTDILKVKGIMQLIQIIWTCANIEEARKISSLLLDKELIACAQLIQGVESMFKWKGKIETQNEIKAIFKTRGILFEEVKQIILEHAEYEVPEILEIPISGGNSAYFEWIEEVTKDFPELE